MRATRGLLASMGAGLSLILAGTAALTFVSALIAFNGWPGVQTERTADERAVFAQVAARDVAEAAAPARIALPAAPRPARPAAVPARRRVAAKAARTVSASSAADARTASAVEAKDPAPAVTPAPAAPEPAPAAPAPAQKKSALEAVSLAPVGEAVKNLGGTLDTTVTQTGNVLGDLVAPVLPLASQAAKDATKALGYVIAALTAAAAEAVAPAAPATGTPVVTDPAGVTVPDPAVLVTP